jgi:tripartite-type tricarboxylate transporter receptor subunit TctC
MIRLSFMLTMWLPSLTCAQDYPVKPVRMVVAFAPGAATDIMARSVAGRLTEVFGHNFIVENRAAGGGGTVGTASVARAAPDGYTLLMANNSTHAVAPHIYKNPGYDALRDFAPVSLAGWIPLVLTTHPALPVKDVKSLIALARQRPGHLLFSSSGTGTTLHLAGELFKSMAKVDLTHVPYKGASLGVVDLIGGQVQLAWISIVSALPLVKQGRLRALGVASARRTAQLPDVPAIAETLPGYEVSNWVGLLAPAQTPPEIVNRLNAEVVRWVALPETQQKMQAQGVDASGGSPAAFGEIIARGHALMGGIVKRSGIKLD